MNHQSPYVSIFPIDGALMCVHQMIYQSWESVMSWCFREVKAKTEPHTQWHKPKLLKITSGPHFKAQMKKRGCLGNGSSALHLPGGPPTLDEE